jgi:transcriptional regulator with XRE-family HTH domain
MELSLEARQRLKLAREVSGLSQAQAALAIGKARISVARWESGDRLPRVEDISRLSELYQVPYTWITEAEGPPPEPTLERKWHALSALQKRQEIEVRNVEREVRETRNNDDDQRLYSKRRFPSRTFNTNTIESSTDYAIIENINQIKSRLTEVLSIRSKLPVVQELSPETINDIASGKVIPVEKYLSDLCFALEIDTRWVLTGEKPDREIGLDASTN